MQRMTEVVGAVLVALSLGACGAGQAELKKRRDQADYHYKLAYGHYFDRQNPSGDAAMQEVQLAIELDPDNADARFLAGIIYMGRAQHLDAIEQFQRAIELRPDFHFALNNLGATYLALERWDDAIGIFERLVLDKKYGTPGTAENNLGWAYYQKGDLEKAETHFQRAKSLSPNLCPPYNNLAMIYIDRGAFESAGKVLESGLKKCPTYAELYYHLGRVEARRSNVEVARERFQRCRELSGESHLSALGPPSAPPESEP
jgi:Tfp pilus assembly protein PilF